jgi:predicted nucleic acid-binding protein
MHAPSLYLDTSVIGGYFDDEWKDATQELFRLADLGLYHFVASVITANEVMRAPAEVQGHFADTFSDPARLLDFTAEAETLAQAYLAAGVVSPKYADDARHIAVATVHSLSLIVSWNFKHLANIKREAGFNAVNLLQGYPQIRILTPLQLLNQTDEDQDL